MINKHYILLALTTFVLPSCTAIGVATGAAATAGVASAQEGGVSRAVSDARIQAEINDLWFKYDVKTFAKLDMTVNQGRVLLTGVVQDPENRVEAVRLAWQPTGVKQVINEIKVDESTGVVGFARDSWITTRLRTAITLDKKIQSLNYSIDTVQGTVYLMGSAQNQAELSRVVETARTIPDVKQVVSYVKIHGQAVENAGQVQTTQGYTTNGDNAVNASQNSNNFSGNVNSGSAAPVSIDAAPPQDDGSPNPAFYEAPPSSASGGPIDLRPVDREVLQ